MESLVCKIMIKAGSQGNGIFGKEDYGDDRIIGNGIFGMENYGGGRIIGNGIFGIENYGGGRIIGNGILGIENYGGRQDMMKNLDNDLMLDYDNGDLIMVNLMITDLMV